MPIICRHLKTTWPQTPMLQNGAKRTPCGDPYVVCCSCGRRFRFDAVEWQIGREIIEPRPVVKGAGA